MSFWVYVRFIIGIFLLVLSLCLFIIQVAGVFKMKYVLNRMHSAAIGDALGLGTAFLGLILLNGLNFTTFKLILVPSFLFFTSPVNSHLVARMETQTDEVKDKYRLCHISELNEDTEADENTESDEDGKGDGDNDSI